VSLNKFGIDTGTWEDTATDRLEWRSLIAEGAISYEERLTRKEETTQVVLHQQLIMYVCADCGKTFRAAIRLLSHKRTHRGSVDLPDNT